MEPRLVIGRSASWCSTCHAAWEARSSKPEARARLERRFEDKVKQTPTCWEWTGARTDRGYGCVSVAGKTCYAHRIAYERQFGPIPEGFDVGHLCRNRGCVHPHHLEAVPRKKNQV